MREQAKMYGGWFAASMLTALLAGCGSAGEAPEQVETYQEPVDPTGAHAPAVDSDEAPLVEPTFTGSLAGGEQVSWYEIAPGQVIVEQDVASGAEPIKLEGLSVAEQYAKLFGAGELPESLASLHERQQRLANASLEEVYAEAEVMGITLPTPDSIEDDMSVPASFSEAPDAEPSLRPLGDPAKTSTSDSAYTSHEFIVFSGCAHGQGEEFERWTNRTGDGIAQLNGIIDGTSFAASFDGSVRVKSQVRQTLAPWWSTLSSDSSLSAGEDFRKHRDGFGIFDLRTKIDQASGDGWHACTRMTFWD